MILKKIWKAYVTCGAFPSSISSDKYTSWLIYFCNINFSYIFHGHGSKILETVAFLYIWKRFVNLLILPSKPYWNSLSIKRIKRGIRTTFKLLHQREIFVYGHDFFVMLYAINYIFGKEKKLDIFSMVDNFCKINNL